MSGKENNMDFREFLKKSEKDEKPADDESKDEKPADNDNDSDED